MHSHDSADSVSILYKCERGSCSKSFQNSSKLEMHLRIHDNYLLKCHFCPYTNCNVHKLCVHLNRHVGYRPYPCNFCDDKFYTLTTRRHHIEAKHEIIRDRYKCTFCDFKTYSPQILRAHKSKSHK